MSLGKHPLGSRFGRRFSSWLTAAGLLTMCAWAGVDGDGQTRLGGDCDDGDSATHTGAAEVCNARDDDCDGSVDESCATTCAAMGLQSSDIVLEATSLHADQMRLAVGRTQLVATSRIAGGSLTPGAWVYRVGPQGELLTAALLDPNASTTAAIAVSMRGDKPGLAWVSQASTPTCKHRQLLEDLTPIATVTNLSAAGTTCSMAQIAWSGAVFGNAWVEQGVTQDSLVFAPQAPAPSSLGIKRTLNSSGSRVGSLAIAPRGTVFGVTWFERVGANTNLMHGEISESSTPLRPARIVLGVGSTARGLRMIWAGDHYVIAWSEPVGSSEEVRGVEVDTTGAKIGNAQVLSANDSLDSVLPDLSWTGTRVVVAWQETETVFPSLQVAKLMSGLILDGGITAVGSSVEREGPPAIRWTGDSLILIKARGAQSVLSSSAIGCVDADGDGVAARIADCDDLDPLRPNTADVCDGVDQDCDLEPDESCPSCPAPEPMPPIPFDQLWNAGQVVYQMKTAWNGNIFGVFWRELRVPSHYQLFFRTIDRNGVPQSPEREITGVPNGPLVGQLAWDGRHFGLVWEDARGYSPGEGNEAFFQLLNVDGSPASEQINVSEMSITSSSSNYQAASPVVAWNGSGFLVAWSDRRDDLTSPEIYTRLLSPTGQPLAPPARVTNYPNSARRPSLAWNGKSYGLAFDLGERTFFRLLGADGRPTTESEFIDLGSREPRVVWAGNQFGVAYLGDPPGCAGNPCPVIAFVDTAGIPDPTPLLLSSEYANSLDVISAGPEVGVSWLEYRSAPVEELYRVARVGVSQRSVLSISDIQQQTGGILDILVPLSWTGDAYSLMWRWQDALGVNHSYRTAIRCCRDLDLDGVSLCTDCDDTNPMRAPGLIESCDSIDNDCDLLIDDGAGAPGTTQGVTFPSKNSLAWSAVAGADAYDAVRGRMALLSLSAGDFSTSTEYCLANDTPLTHVPDGQVPVAGDAYFYLTRAVGCGGQRGSYDDASGGQVGLRDMEISAAIAACP